MSDLAHAHNIKVVFSSITPVSEYHVRGVPQTTTRPMERIKAMNEWIKSYAASHGDVYLDYFSAMVDDKGLMRAELTEDDLHPNAKGYAIMVGEEPSDRQPMGIVGVVQDAAFTSVRDAVEPTLYASFAQSLDPRLIESFPSMSLSIRPVGAIPPVRLSSAVAAAIARVDGAATVSFQTLTETLSTYYIRERLLALLSGYFGFFALLLGAVGVYGVTAHAVSRRRTEIGVRMIPTRSVGPNPVRTNSVNTSRARVAGMNSPMWYSSQKIRNSLTSSRAASVAA